jgi:hypothetical protein
MEEEREHRLEKESKNRQNIFIRSKADIPEHSILKALVHTQQGHVQSKQQIPCLYTISP